MRGSDAAGQRGEAGAESLEERREPADVHVAVEAPGRRATGSAGFPAHSRGRRAPGRGRRAPTIARRDRGRDRRRRDGDSARRAASRRSWAAGNRRCRSRRRPAGRRGGQGRPGRRCRRAGASSTSARCVTPAAITAQSFSDDEQRQVAQRPGALEGVAIGAVGDALFADIALDGRRSGGRYHRRRARPSCRRSPANGRAGARPRR